MSLTQDQTIKLSFKPTKKWEKVVFDPQLLQLFFKVGNIFRAIL